MEVQNENIMSHPDYDAQRDVIVKWIKVLFLCQIAGICTTALGAVAALSTVIVWGSRAVSIVTVAALFSMAAVNERYRKAALFHTIAVGGGILSEFLELELLGSALSICSLVGTYHELNAHAEIVAPKNEKLAKRWHALFYYEIVVGLLAGVAAAAAVMIAAFAEADPEMIVSVALVITAVVSVVIELVRAAYLKQTLALYQE